MVKMKTLKKWNLIINLLFIFYFIFTMDKIPYRIIINRYIYARKDLVYFNINIPKYFANYKYFKIILKEVTCTSRDQDIWLNCDASTYNQISQHTDPKIRGVYLEKFLFNLTAFRERGLESHYVILPYRDTLIFWISDFEGAKINVDMAVVMIIELEPYEI